MAKVEQLGTQQWAANRPHRQPAAVQNTGRFVLAYPGPEQKMFCAIEVLTKIWKSDKIELHLKGIDCNLVQNGANKRKTGLGKFVD